jgi:hypothetical protein
MYGDSSGRVEFGEGGGEGGGCCCRTCGCKGLNEGGGHSRRRVLTCGGGWLCMKNAGSGMVGCRQRQLRTELRTHDILLADAHTQTTGVHNGTRESVLL